MYTARKKRSWEVMCLQQWTLVRVLKIRSLCCIFVTVKNELTFGLPYGTKNVYILSSFTGSD